jgi:SAM-dependent methyltransferase
MRLCLNCEAPFVAVDWTCPACGFTPEKVEGFPCFAPALARENSDYDPAHYGMLVELEDTSFWFGARNRLILWAITRCFPKVERLMEIGVGTGYAMQAIRAALPGATITASDINIEGLRFAAERLPGSVDLLQFDARRIPFREEFDVICMFDALEHIGEDTQVLAQLRQTLRPGGGILLTVPQHMSLWGPADEVAFHQRRYEPEELRAKAAAAGFRVVLKTSFVSLLYPALWASRWRIRRFGGYKAEAEHHQSRRVGPLLEAAMAVEFAGIRAGLRPPFGGSQLLAAVRD